MKNQKSKITVAEGDSPEGCNQKIIVAMSGGVDSSVAAARLKRAGFNVIGVFMRFWRDSKTKDSWNRCCSPETEKRARQVAASLGIPFYVFNLEKEFKKKIVDYFLTEYKKGRTPNPCVFCNKEIKFGVLLEKALALKADFVATGHYVKKIKMQKSKCKMKNQNAKSIYKLLKAKDRTRDQSYFLWQLSQKQLKHILFPLGDLTKKEVRNLSKKFDLPVSGIPESREICFITTTVNDFLARYLKQKPGKIANTKGKIIGQHQGLAFYTIGQRRGLGISGGPYWVLDKDLKRNLLIITKSEKDLEKRGLSIDKINWISGKAPKLPLRIEAKIRYKHKEAPVILTKDKKSRTYRLKFDKPQRAITPGQSVVFYKNDELLGGGIIISNWQIGHFFVE